MSMKAAGAASEFWRNPQWKSPFHDRIEALMTERHWYDWAGYAAPEIIDDSELEYFAIRSTAALFDISPMVKYSISGPDAEQFLNHLTLRDVSKLKAGRVQYTAWCDDDGQVLDDGTLFRFDDSTFRLCCQERHLPWLMDTAFGYDVTVREETEEIAALALQGPTSAALLRDAGIDVSGLKPFQIAALPKSLGRGHISRTGFTGDLGYELFVDRKSAGALWDHLWQHGTLRGLRAIGYHALNIARIEAGFIVANADFVTSETALRSNRPRLPDEIGLDWMVDLTKPHFNGKRAIEGSRRSKSRREVLVGLEIEGNEPAQHAIVYHAKRREVGVVTAGIWSPTAKRNIALACVDARYETGDNLWVEIYALRELRYHKLMKRARIVERPFIKLPRRTLTPPGDF
jgi:aminomethyltransferase